MKYDQNLVFCFIDFILYFFNSYLDSFMQMNMISLFFFRNRRFFLHFDFILLSVIAPVWFWTVKTNVEKVIKNITTKWRLNSRTHVARRFAFIKVIHFFDVQTRFDVLPLCLSLAVVRIYNWKRIYLINYKLLVFILNFEMTIIFTSTIRFGFATDQIFFFCVLCTPSFGWLPVLLNKSDWRLSDK